MADSPEGCGVFPLADHIVDFGTDQFAPYMGEFEFSDPPASTTEPTSTPIMFSDPPASTTEPTSTDVTPDVTRTPPTPDALAHTPQPMVDPDKVRREKNRISAAKSREQTKRYIAELEVLVRTLTSEKAALVERCGACERQNREFHNMLCQIYAHTTFPPPPRPVADSFPPLPAASSTADLPTRGSPVVTHFSTLTGKTRPPPAAAPRKEARINPPTAASAAQPVTMVRAARPASRKATTAVACSLLMMLTSFVISPPTFPTADASAVSLPASTAVGAPTPPLPAGGRRLMQVPSQASFLGGVVYPLQGEHPQAYRYLSLAAEMLGGWSGSAQLPGVAGATAVDIEQLLRAVSSSTFVLPTMPGPARFEFGNAALWPLAFLSEQRRAEAVVVDVRAVRYATIVSVNQRSHLAPPGATAPAALEPGQRVLVLPLSPEGLRGKKKQHESYLRLLVLASIALRAGQGAEAEGMGCGAYNVSDVTRFLADAALGRQGHYRSLPLGPAGATPEAGAAIVPSGGSVLLPMDVHMGSDFHVLGIKVPTLLLNTLRILFHDDVGVGLGAGSVVAAALSTDTGTSVMA